MTQEQKEEKLKKHHRLSGISFEHEGAHIALCHKDNPAANNRETVIWKSRSTSHIQKEDINKALNGEVVFNSDVKEALTSAIKEKFAERYEWIYVDDFSAEQVVFSADSGMYVVGYSLSTDGYVIEDVASGVEYKYMLVDNDKVKLSAEAQKTFKEENGIVLSLITKALNFENTKNNVIVAIEKQKEKKMEDVQKAVDAAVQQKDELIKSLQGQLTAAQDALAAEAEAKKAILLKAREEKLATLDKDQAVDLCKATAELDDAAFAVVFASLEKQKNALEQSDLFKQVGANGTSNEKVEMSTDEKLFQAAFGKK